MAEGQAIRVSPDEEEEEEASPDVARSGRRSSAPSDAEYQVTATIQATGESSSRLGDAEQASHHVVEFPDPPADSAPNPARSLWTRLQTGWSEIDDQLAEWFGLNQSKYQWAVDELLDRQSAGDHQAASKATEEGLQMQVLQEQTMQRDSKRLSFEDL